MNWKITLLCFGIFFSSNALLGQDLSVRFKAGLGFSQIIGDKETEENTVSVRLRNGDNINGLSQDEFVTQLRKEIKRRDLESSFVETSS